MSQYPDNFKKLRVLIGTPDVAEAQQVVIGRSQLVDHLWGKLSSGSISLLSERRMGKTWVLILARAKKPEWAIPLFLDVESLNSPAEFVRKLNQELYRSGLIPDSWWDKIQDWFRRQAQKLQGKKIGSIEVPEIDLWDSLLEDTCSKLIEKGGGKQAVIMVDELPLLLDKIITSRRMPEEAISILDKLRSLRQSMPSLRMVFCGSLGLHIVLRKLQEKGYTGRPVNDMLPFEVPPLAPEDACYLSGCLLLGEGIGCSDILLVAVAVAKVSSGVPFFIQKIVNWMGNQIDKQWAPEEIILIPEQLFNDPGESSIFSYYDERLDLYYPDDIVEKARAALDLLSRSPEGLHFDNLLNLVRHRPKTLMIDEEPFLKVLNILNDDHYVVHRNGQWRFKLEIVRHWWYEGRGRLAL